MRIVVCHLPGLVREVLEDSFAQRGHVIVGCACLRHLCDCRELAVDALLLGGPLEDDEQDALARVRASRSEVRIVLLLGVTEAMPLRGAHLLDAVVAPGSTFAELERTLAGAIRPRPPRPVRHRPAWSPDAHLSPRERDVVRLLASGMSSLEMAERLGLSISTIQTHVQGVLRKLGAKNRADAVNRYLRATSPVDLAAAG